MPVYSEKQKGKVKYYYMACYVDNKGQHKRKKSKRYDSATEAKKEEANFLLRCNKEENNKITFEQIYYDYMKYYKSKNKQSSYYSLLKKANKYILEYFKDYIVSKINLNDIDNWKEKLPKALSASYKNNFITYFKSIIRRGIIYYDIQTNIIEKIENFPTKYEKAKEVNIWTIEEFNKFIKVVDDPIYKCLFITLFYCGLRKGEALALNWNDISNTEISISKTVNNKTFNHGYEVTPPKTSNSIRKVLMPLKVKESLAELHKYYETFYKFNNKWFIFGGIEPITYTTLTRRLKEYCTLSGVKIITPHELRHSHVSLLIDKGCSEQQIADRLGHSVDMVRNTYSHLYESKRLEVKKILDTLNDL